MGHGVILKGILCFFQCYTRSIKHLGIFKTVERTLLTLPQDSQNCKCFVWKALSQITQKQLGFSLYIQFSFSTIICRSYYAEEVIPPCNRREKNRGEITHLLTTIFYFCFIYMFKLVLTAHEVDKIFMQTLQGNHTGYQNWVSKHLRKLITFELPQQRL